MYFNYIYADPITSYIRIGKIMKKGTYMDLQIFFDSE